MKNKVLTALLLLLCLQALPFAAFGGEKAVKPGNPAAYLTTKAQRLSLATLHDIDDGNNRHQGRTHPPKDIQLWRKRAARPEAKQRQKVAHQRQNKRKPGKPAEYHAGQRAAARARILYLVGALLRVLKIVV